jgi:hypothetical protein
VRNIRNLRHLRHACNNREPATAGTQAQH